MADFSASPSSGPPSLIVTFTDLSTGGPTSWAWDFGDGTTATEQNPSHTYTAVGNYDVSLTVTNDSGSDAFVDYNCVQVTVTQNIFYLPIILKKGS